MLDSLIAKLSLLSKSFFFKLNSECAEICDSSNIFFLLKVPK